MSLARDVAGIVATNVASLPLALATNVLLARGLSVEDRGLYALLVGFSGVALVVADLGWSAAIVQRILRERVAPARALSAALAGTLAAAAALAIGCVWLREPLSQRFLSSAPALPFWIALASVPALLLGELARGAARALGRFDLANWYGLAQAAGTLLALAAVLLPHGGSLLQALAALLAVNVAVAAWLLAWLVRRTGVERRVDAREAAAGLRFGAKAYVNYLTMRLHDQLDLFLIAYLLPGASDVAVYAIAAGTIARLVVVPTSLAVALFPRLAEARDDDAARLSSFATRHGLWLTLGIALLLAPIARPVFLLLYGAEYAGSVAPFWLLLPGLVGLTASRLLGRWFLALDRQAPTIAARVLAIALNVAANAALVPALGISGAAIAKSLSLLVEGGVVAFAFASATRSRLAELWLPRDGDAEPYRRRLQALRARVRG